MRHGEPTNFLIERMNRLRLIRSENVGPITFHRLLERFGTAAKALEACSLAKQGGRGKPIAIATKAAAQEEIGELEAMGGNSSLTARTAIHRYCRPSTTLRP